MGQTQQNLYSTSYSRFNQSRFKSGRGDGGNLVGAYEKGKRKRLIKQSIQKAQFKVRFSLDHEESNNGSDRYSPDKDP